MKNKYILCLLCMGIFISIIIIGVVARKSLSFYENGSIPVISHIKENEYMYNETLVFLQKYIHDSKAKLSIENEDEKEHILRELMIIAKLEKKNIIQHMSVDGREISISLLKDIYKIYGLDIFFDMDGEIQMVDDPLGNIIYQNTDNILELKYQLVNLIIVVIIILAFISISLFITKKNKLLVRNGDYDGHDEKKFA